MVLYVCSLSTWGSGSRRIRVQGQQRQHKALSVNKSTAGGEGMEGVMSARGGGMEGVMGTGAGERHGEGHRGARGALDICKCIYF